MAKKNEIIEKMREQLLASKQKILDSLNTDIGSDIRSQASGDSADVASDSVHMDLRSHLAERDSRELTQIMEALSKIEQGTYGLCEDCGCQIPLDRLQAIPFALLCFDCQSAADQDEQFDSRAGYRNWDKR